MLKNLMLKNFVPFQLYLQILNPTPEILSRFFQCYAIGVDWYLQSTSVTIDSGLRCFQYKILHNVLHLNKKNLFLFSKTDTKTQNYVLFAALRMKQSFIFSQVVSKLIFFGLIFWNMFFRCQSRNIFSFTSYFIII